GTTASLTSIVPHFSAAQDHESNTCATPTIGTNTRSEERRVGKERASPITVTATAIWHFSLGANSANVTRSDNSGATARFVDANTSVASDGVSEVGHAQTVTITTNSLHAGTTASLTSIVPHFSAAQDHESNTCATPTIGTNT